MINKLSTQTFQTNFSNKIQNTYKCKMTEHDYFTPSFAGNKNKKPSLFQVVKNIFDSNKIKYEPISTREPTVFQTDISNGIKNTFCRDIPAQNFENIMSPNEFKELLPNLKEENFIFNESYNENTLYFIDLDYQTLFSNGNSQIDVLLEKVEEHAKKYYEKTGKKFIFAITDKDNLHGVQHAVREIGQNPEKYQHFKLLPAVKYSYTHEAPTSNIGYENSELLVYGINPFSPNLTKFTDNIIEKRKGMMLNFIKEIDKLYPEFGFNILEFVEQNRLLYSKDYTVSNLYWRIREYAEGKGGNTIKGSKTDIDNAYKEVANILSCLGNSLFGQREMYGDTCSNIQIKDDELNQSIREIFKKYSTHEGEKGKLTSAAENTFEEIIECLSKEKDKPTIAFASPYYLSHYFEERNHDEKYENVVDYMKKTIKNSNGMITAFESVSPVYQNDIYVSKERIDRFNDTIRNNFDLYEIGGTLYSK